MPYFLLTMWAMFSVSAANYPVFEGASQLKRLFVPADVHIGSVVYRLRASDHDREYPLQFDATDYGSYVVRVENLPCNVNSTYCEANVYLDRVLVAGQNFKFRFTVRDTKGDTTTASSSIEVTNAPVDITAIFPHMPGIIVIPEDTKVGTELEYVIVRKHPEHTKASVLEIRGAPVLDFGRARTSPETTTGVITLVRALDFEQQNMYKIQIFALDMYTDKAVDSRNIAGFDLLLIIQDVQDTPPVFTYVEPTVKLRSNLTQGDAITKVIAVDGDRGNPRQIKYGLVSESNPFTIFFNIDRITGQVTLAKPLKQLMAISRSHQPILLTILAEEERLASKDPPSMSTTATIALLLDEVGNTAPYFDNDHYVCYLNENSPLGTALVFSDAYSTQVHDDDMGKQGVFSLQLDKNNDTFEITPNVIERKAYFTIRVRNVKLLDFEARPSVQFMIVAKELDPGSLSTSASVLVYLNDVNDNPPQFQKTKYVVQIPENVTANSLLVEVKTTDVDTGLAGRVHYTRIVGYRNGSLHLNSITGAITIATDNHGFDREESSEYQMTVEARDMEGSGLLATVPLIIKILDVNDETPVFENTPYHYTLTSDMRNFSTRAYIKATDKDAESPNNVVRYEITSGNYNNTFVLNSETGELTVRYSEVLDRLRKRRQVFNPSALNTYVLTVRAYDLGIPHRWATTQVKIFPPDSGTRLLNFLMPTKGMNYNEMEELLTKMTGGKVSILEVNAYRPQRFKRAETESPRKLASNEKNMVVARVTYGENSVVDVEQVFYLLQNILIQKEDQAEIRTAESGASFYWIVVILILLLIALLIVALLCYLCKCCPCMSREYFSRNKNKVHPSETSQTVDLINKGVQANNRVETQSSSNSSHQKRNWKFYRRDSESRPQAQPVLLIPAKNVPSPARHRRQNAANEEMPSFIYRANLAEYSTTMDQHGDIYIQDIAETEYRILDPSRLNLHRMNEQVNADARKYENSRRCLTEKNQITDSSPAIEREESFVREGNAEILRLQTNEEQKRYAHRNLYQTSESNLPYPMFPTSIPGDAFIAGTHSTSELSEENAPDKADNSKREKDSAPDTKNTQPPRKMANGVLRMEKLNQQGEAPLKKKTSNELAETVETQTSADKTDERIRNLMDPLHLEEERNRLTSFQRDLLLARFLVEEQRRYLKNPASDTLSLPGSLSMGTQTDRHRATQTDVLCLMRPEPRRVKSENDDSSDSDVDCLTSTRRISRRTFSIIGKNKNNRHKIRTPIIEESESTEILRHSSSTKPSQRDNRTSVLRLTNNRNKIKEITVNGKTERYDRSTLKQSKIHKSAVDVSEHKPPERNVHHVSLRDGKKSVSYSNLSDANVLTDKDMYTPRSLKSRLIAKRLCASEPPKLEAHHCMSHKQQELKERQKCDVKDPCAAEWSRRIEEKKKEGDRQRSRPQKRPDSEMDETDSSRSKEDNAIKDAVVTVENERTEGNSPTPAMVAGSTLKLKSKNQQLMEKKSVFTIAYDDATTEHLGNSSNGSNNE